MTTWSMVEFSRAREAVAALLEALDLDAYLFQVEPVGRRWHVTVEWARAQQWNRVDLEADYDELLRSLDDAATRSVLLAAWRRRLGLD